MRGYILGVKPAKSSFPARPAQGYRGLVGRLLGAYPGIQATDELVAQLCVYLDELSLWGARIDLVAPRTVEELVDLSLADAACIAEQVLRRGDSAASWIDVGSGGGAPGLPLFLFLRPLGVSLTLLEPRAKRVAFLRSVTTRLGDDALEVRRGRSENLPSSTYASAVSRATLPPPEWLQEGSRLATERVWLLLAREEAPETPESRVDLDLNYEWPLTGARRRILSFCLRAADPGSRPIL